MYQQHPEFIEDLIYAVGSYDRHFQLNRWTEDVLDAGLINDCLLKENLVSLIKKYGKLVHISEGRGATPESRRNMLHAWEVSAIGELADFSGHELADTMLAIERLRTQPSPKFFARWQEEMTKKMDECDEHDLSAILHLGNIRLAPSDEFLAAWTHRAEEVLQEPERDKIRFLSETSYRLAQIASYCSAPGALPESVVHGINQFVYDQDNIPLEDMQQLYLADQYFRRRSGMPLFHFDYCALFAADKDSTYDVSATEDRIADFLGDTHTVLALKARGTTMQRGFFVEEIAAPVDISFHQEGNPKPVQVVQVDGPYHYVQTLEGNEIYDGKTWLQNTLLVREDIPPIRIDIRRVERLSEEEFEAYWGHVLENIQYSAENPMSRPRSGISERS